MKATPQRKSNHAILTSFSVLVCLAAIASTAAFILSRISLQRAHQAKWRDYDDCGIS